MLLRILRPLAHALALLGRHSFEHLLRTFAQIASLLAVACGGLLILGKFFETLGKFFDGVAAGLLVGRFLGALRAGRSLWLRKLGGRRSR